MTTVLTAGTWRTAPLRRCGCDWPFDWIAEITCTDPAAGAYQHVATIHQSGTRPMAEAAANVRAMGEAAAMARLGQILDMSDPEHDGFADSAADCLDALFRQSDEIRRILARLACSSAGAPRPVHVSRHPCHHD